MKRAERTAWSCASRNKRERPPGFGPIKKVPELFGKLRDFYIHEALTYIEHNFQNDITIEDIASVCGLNRTYFGKIFKEALGKTPQEFLVNYRMLKAAELLKLTHLSIGDIGITVGYANQMHFSRAFKNCYGVSPREWRNQNRLPGILEDERG